MAEGAPYILNDDTTLTEVLDDDGQPVQVPKGATVVPAVYCNSVVGGGKHAVRWYTPFALGDPAGKVRVPTHLVLLAGFEMGVAVAPAGAKVWV